ncbi:MAG: glutamate-1-semialdehyde 2,1-aminomutase [Tissierellia bacterium]|nr:glutamate-1-semialdehyde 2,1-aminomutase [Tissierellia bacterium]
MSLYNKAKSLMPGGVNSPVRAFGSVKREPIFIHSAKGPYVYDVDGKQYIDFITSWGPMILGHGREDLIEKAKVYLEEGLTFGLPSDIEVEMAELVTSATDTDLVRMVNSGTEATMSAIRLARGYTGKKKIIKFEGCYHGHSDSLLVKSGSGTLTFNTPTSAGVPEDTIKHTIVCRYNDIDDVKKAIESNKDDIACVIIEPIAGNMGVVPGNYKFMQELREITSENGIVLIFDEVITGFRVKYGSIAPLFDIVPDLYCFGKIIGGGLPVGAFAGPEKIMRHLSPDGDVYQAGTLSGNPLAMKMGRDVLNILREDKEIYERLEEKAIKLENGFNENLKSTGVSGKVVRYKSMLCLFFGEFDEIKSYDDIKNANTEMYSEYFSFMLDRGIVLPPAQFEAIFISDAQTDEILDYTIEQNRLALEHITKNA